jgi:cell division protein FtsQ
LSTWGAGKKRKYNGSVVSRKNISYRTPKVFTKRYKKPPKTVSFKLSRKAIENILIVVAVIIAAYILLFSSYFKIKDIIVEGNKTIPTADLRASIPENANLLTLRTAPLKADLMKKYPQIKELAFFKGLPNAIKIQIVERDATLVWQTGGQRYLVDPEGVVNRTLAADEVTTLPVIADDRNRPVQPDDYLVTPDFINFVTYLTNHFHDETNLNMTSMAIDETTYDLTVTTDANIKVFFDTTANPSDQLENFKKILVSFRDKITEYVDLRVEGWGYYK